MSRFVFRGLQNNEIEPANQLQLDRIKRALHQRIYVVESTNGNNGHDVHTIMGASDTEYEVVIHRTNLFRMDHTCNCPDFSRRGQPCKHIYSALFRIYKLAPEVFVDPDDTEELLAENFHERRQYSRYQGPHAVDDWLDEDEEPRPKKKIKRVVMATEAPEDAKECGTCSVCYEEFDGEEAQVWCIECKQTIHADCKRQWFKKNKTCPLCRHKYTA